MHHDNCHILKICNDLTQKGILIQTVGRKQRNVVEYDVEAYQNVLTVCPVPQMLPPV